MSTPDNNNLKKIKNRKVTPVFLSKKVSASYLSFLINNSKTGNLKVPRKSKLVFHYLPLLI